MSDVIAPKIDDEEEVSFAAYFLRDLQARGKLNPEAVMRAVSEADGISSSYEAIMSAINDVSGESITRELSLDIDRIARSAPAMN